MMNARAERSDDYRWLGIVATAVGAVALLVGLLMSNADVAITGGLIAMVHGLLSLVLYAVGRRRPAGDLDRT